MLGLLLRFSLLAAVLVGVALLFVYAFFIAIVVAPIVAIALFLLGRKQNVRSWVVRTGPGFSPDPRRHNPPIIDHDPNDLPPR